MTAKRVILNAAIAIFSCATIFVTTAQAVQPAQSETRQSGTSQESSATLRTEPTLKARTRLVLLDVVATDGKGAAVTDLKQDEFALTEDGKKQQIRALSFQDSRVRSNPPAEASTMRKAALPPNVFTNIHATRQTGALNILLLDGLNTRMDNQAYVRDQLLKFLERLPEDQPVAIYLLGVKLRMLQDFTDNPETLKTVLRNFKIPHSPLMENAAGGQENFWLEGMFVPANVKQRILEFQQQSDASQTDSRVALTLSALKTLANNVAGHPGRKNLIWVSEAIPIAFEPTLAPGSGTRQDYAPAISDVANLLANAQVAVYPVDARALVTDGPTAADEYDRRGNRNGSGGGQAGQAINDIHQELSVAHDAMNRIAEYTGGRAFYNQNDIDNAVQQSMEDGSTSYTLGYYPENKSWNGRFRKISVKVSRPGVKLRFRLGYFAIDPQSYEKQSQDRRDADFSITLTPDIPDATALSFVAGVLPPSPKTGSKAIINFAVEPQNLSFLDENDGNKHANVACAVRVFRISGGEPIKTEVTNVAANLPPESYRKVGQTGVPCRTELALAAGDYLLRLGVRDNHTGLIGTANAHLTVPSEAAGNKP